MIKKERKSRLLFPRQPYLSLLSLNPFSTAPPCHILSFTIAAISHLLMSCHSICASIFLHATLCSPSFPPSLSVCLSYYACYIPPQYKVLTRELVESHLQLDYSSSCQHTCHFVCTHVLVKCDSLCAREWQQFVLSFVPGSTCFTVAMT